MKVQISHNVDVGGDNVYNFLVYDFLLSDCRVRARAYADTMTEVTLMGRFKPDGSPLAEMVSPLELATGGLSDEQKLAKTMAFLEAMDARRATEFPDVLDYLRSRFAKVQQYGPTGPEVVGVGFTFEEREARSEGRGVSTAPHRQNAMGKAND